MTTAKSNPKNKSGIAIEIEYWLFLLLANLIRALSFRRAYALARAGAALIYALDSKHRTRALQHIMHSGIVQSEEEARRLAKANFRHMGMVFVEIVKADQILTEGNFKDYVEIEPDDEATIEAVSGSQRQVILATAHLGNWELAGSFYCLASGMEMSSIMRPVNNPKIGEYIYRKRTGGRHKTFSRERGIRPLLEALKKGETATIVCDQHAGSKEGVETSFFGHPARTHATPALLHLKTGIPIWPAVILRRPGEEFRFVFRSSKMIRHKPSGDREADVKAVSQAITTEIERLIRTQPEQWLWPHRRWLDINRKRPYTPQEAKAND